MIPTTYKTEAEALAIRAAYQQGTQAATSMLAPGSPSTNASLGGVLTATAIERIQTTNLTSPTATISTTVSGGFTAADAAYIDGMRTRITEAIADYYADKPNLSPFNANNKQTSQTDANVRDNLLQAIFKYDPRYGQRMRLSESESFLYRDTGSYQLPNRNSFIYNPYIEATMRVHGATDITVIDDTGTDGHYRITTNKPHGLYTGQLISADRTVTPIPSVDTHSLRVISSLTQETTTSTTAPTNSYYTTTGNHNFVQGQRFIPENNDLGLVGGNFDSTDRFLGYQRERFIKPLTATTFELHRNYACTDRITAGYYNGSANHSQEGAGAYLVSGVTMQVIDGVPVLFDPISGTNTAVAVFQRDTISAVDITTGVFTVSATIKQGIQDGMLINFNNFTGTTWSGIDEYDRPLYFKKVSDTSFTLHTDPTTLTGATLWRPGTTFNTQDLDAIQYTSSTWTLTFLRPHNVIHGQDFRLQSVGSEFGGQQIDTYTYSGAGTAYWTMDTTSDHIMDGTRIVIANNTSTGPGTTFDINGVEQTMPTNLYVKRRGAAGSKELELYTDAALTTRWEPYTTAGTHTVETNTFLCNVYYAKVNSSTVIELYSEPTLTTKWNPSLGSGSVTAIASGATGNTITTEYVTTRTSPGGGYIQPMFFPKTEGYTFISLYKDAALTQQYQLTGGGVVTSGSMTGGPSIGLGGLEPGDPSLTVDTYEATPTCYRMNNISHRFVMTDAGNGSGTALNTLVFAGTPSILPAYYIAKITGSNTIIELYIDSALATPVRSGGGSPNAPVIASAGTSGGIKASIYQQAGNYRLDKIYGRNMGLLTYYRNNYNTGTSNVNAQVTGTWYPSHYETNLVFNYAGEPLNWPGLTTVEYSLDSAGIYKGHLRPCKGMTAPVSNDSVTGRFGVDNSLYGVVDGSPVYYNLSQPGRFTTSSPFILGIKAEDDEGTFVEDPLTYNGAQWDLGTSGQEDRRWPDTIAPQTMTWTIEQPTQVLETVNMNRYTRTRDLSQYRLKLTYPPMTSGQIQEYIAVIHAARGAAKPFRFYMPRSNLIPVTLSMQNKSVQMPANFFVRNNLTAGTRILEVDGLPPNKTENDPAMFNGCGCNMRVFNAMGSMMMPISNVRTNAYGEANIRINNGIPTDIDVGHWFDSFIIYLDVFIDGNSIDIKVDTRGFHYLEIDMVTKRVF